MSLKWGSLQNHNLNNDENGMNCSKRPRRSCTLKKADEDDNGYYLDGFEDSQQSSQDWNGALHKKAGVCMYILPRETKAPAPTVSPDLCTQFETELDVERARFKTGLKPVQERVEQLEDLLRDSQDEVERMDQENRRLKKTLGAHHIRLFEDLRKEEENEGRVRGSQLEAERVTLANKKLKNIVRRHRVLAGVNMRDLEAYEVLKVKYERLKLEYSEQNVECERLRTTISACRELLTF